VDQKDLGVERYDAGRDYLAALRDLKLEPEALFWAYDKSMGQFVLVLVTSLFDFAGPLALTKLLFDAYNAAATPKAIDPFILRLHSPKHALYRAAQANIGNRLDGWSNRADLKGTALDRATISGEFMPPIVASFRAGDLEGFGTWVYKSTPVSKGVKAVELGSRWRRFEHAVHALAA
jgi:hypothetical protein